jgi:hypothetical protein
MAMAVLKGSDEDVRIERMRLSLLGRSGGAGLHAPRPAQDGIHASDR